MKRASPFVCRARDLSRAWTNREMHLHTDWTDGTPTIAQVIRRAEELGLDVIAFTEHVRADSDWFERFAGEVRAAAKGSPVQVLVSAEAAVVDQSGRLNLSPAIRGLCDLVVGSVHRFPGRDGTPVPFSDVPRDEFARREYELARAAMLRGEADVLGHPGGMSMRRLGDFPPEYVEALMEASNESGVAFEINTAYIRDLPLVMDLAQRINPWVSLGSDAHVVQAMGTCRDKVREVLWQS